MKKVDSTQLELGELPPDYVDDDAIIAAEQEAPAPFASSTTLLGALFRALVPNRWPKR